MDLETTLRDSLERTKSLLADADRGRLVRRGSRIALVGPVNAGKSTLFNRLLGEDRALVDAAPGTTRDIVEGRFEWQGLVVTLLDTAGLRREPGRLEALGIERAREAASSSDLVILVVPPEANQADVSEWSRDLGVADPLRVHSKSDLFQDRSAKERYVSGLTGEGVDELRRTLVSTLMGSEVPGTVLLTSERHVEALHRFATHLEQAVSAVDASTLEVVSGELGIALDALGEVLGRLSGITRERLEPRRLILSPLAERTHHSAIGVKQYGSSSERSGNLSPIARAGVPLEAPRQLSGNHCTGHSDHQSKECQKEGGLRGHRHHPARLDVCSNCHARRQHHRKVHYGVQCLLALAHSLNPSVTTTLAECTRTLFIHARQVNCARKRLFPVAFRRARQFCGSPE